MRTGACLLFVLSVGVLTGCWGSGRAKSDSEKKDAFREVMGFAPPTSITEIRSDYYYMRDSYIRWLQFKCDVEVFAKIEKQAGLLAASGDNPRWAPGFSDRSKNPNAPAWWWDVQAATRFREFEREVSKDHVSDRAHFWVDSTTGTVFASREVID